MTIFALFMFSGRLSYGLPDRLCLKIVQQKHRRTTPVSIRTSTLNRNKDDSIKALWTPRQSENLQISTESSRVPHFPKQIPHSSYVAALQEREHRFGYQASLVSFVSIYFRFSLLFMAYLVYIYKHN
jgi:hypothetical protein